MFDKVQGEVPEIWQVQPVQPDHGPGTVLSVVMPVPGRRQDDVPTLHLDALAVDCGEAAIALDDEAHCKCCVAMCRRGLVGHHQLKPGINGVCRVRRVCAGCVSANC